MTNTDTQTAQPAFPDLAPKLSIAREGLVQLVQTELATENQRQIMEHATACVAAFFEALGDNLATLFREEFNRRGPAFSCLKLEAQITERSGQVLDLIRFDRKNDEFWPVEHPIRAHLDCTLISFSDFLEQSRCEGTGVPCTHVKPNGSTLCWVEQNYRARVKAGKEALAEAFRHASKHYTKDGIDISLHSEGPHSGPGGSEDPGDFEARINRNGNNYKVIITINLTAPLQQPSTHA